MPSNTCIHTVVCNFIKIIVLCDVTTFSVVVWCQGFRENCCLSSG